MFSQIINAQKGTDRILIITDIVRSNGEWSSSDYNILVSKKQISHHGMEDFCTIIHISPQDPSEGCKYHGIQINDLGEHIGKDATIYIPYENIKSIVIIHR